MRASGYLVCSGRSSTADNISGDGRSRQRRHDRACYERHQSARLSCRFVQTAFARRTRPRFSLAVCRESFARTRQDRIFNRSHYEEVLVVRVHPEILQNQQLPPGMADDKDIWKERFESIRDWEKHLVKNGTHILKFFLNVSREEQKQWFLDRINEPEKNWKFSMGDVKERGHWEDYMAAYADAIEETSTEKAPWFIIPADKKWFMLCGRRFRDNRRSTRINETPLPKRNRSPNKQEIAEAKESSKRNKKLNELRRGPPPLYKLIVIIF